MQELDVAVIQDDLVVSIVATGLQKYPAIENLFEIADTTVYVVDNPTWRVMQEITIVEAEVVSSQTLACPIGGDSYGFYPIETIAAQAGDSIEIDCSQNFGVVIDCQALPALTFLQIHVSNWPTEALGIVRFLLINVPKGGLAMGWPNTTFLPFPALAPGYDNEYELRSWNGGLTISSRRLAVYPQI